MRESVDVIIPFRGSGEEFEKLAARLSDLRLGAHDSLTVVDNSRQDVVERTSAACPMRIVTARGRQSSYYARNQGAAGGRGAWLLFLDADVDPVPDLIDRYPAFFWNSVSMHIGDGIKLLNLNVSGRQWVANLYHHVLCAENSDSMMGPQR